MSRSTIYVAVTLDHAGLDKRQYRRARRRLAKRGRVRVGKVMTVRLVVDTSKFTQAMKRIGESARRIGPLS